MEGTEGSMRNSLSQSLLGTALFAVSAVAFAGPVLNDRLSPESAACVECHRQATPAIYQQWGDSKHFRGNVGCAECHGSKRGEPGAIEHNGTWMHVIVTP